MEAARAGSAGKGFAVVADEVRNRLDHGGNLVDALGNLHNGGGLALHGFHHSLHHGGHTAEFKVSSRLGGGFSSYSAPAPQPAPSFQSSASSLFV